MRNNVNVKEELVKVVHSAVPAIHQALLAQEVRDRCVQKGAELQKAVGDLDRLRVMADNTAKQETSMRHAKPHAFMLCVVVGRPPCLLPSLNGSVSLVIVYLGFDGPSVWHGMTQCMMWALPLCGSASPLGV